ncbi:MAG: RNA polymerase sigma factor [Candidatus Daviesbacteria bacterium]|nr:MAG: RNA polymerase sigma factor [Candidatus Daviesbacteria bacterium]
MEVSVIKLVIQAQKGDKDAFGQIYSLFFKRIFRYVYYSVFNRPLAEDITQDTFLRAFRALPGFSTRKGTFQAFLFAIARNLVIDHARKKRELSLELVGDLPSSEDFEDEIDAEREKQMIYQALAHLDDFEKQLVILRFFEEFSYEEIAQVTQKNAGAVRVRVHRSLKKLQEYLLKKERKDER